MAIEVPMMARNEPNQQSIIIGGYASHGWRSDSGTAGDESCFLFNLNQNLRFMAKPVAPGPYQSTVTDPRGSITKLQFGTTDLIINGPDLRNVTSLVNPNKTAT